MATNGPYGWGNGPQPPKKQGIIARLIEAAVTDTGKKKKPKKKKK